MNSKTVAIIFLVILVNCINTVYTVDVNTGSDEVCKKSKFDLANGTQNKDGECEETVMGEIPNADNMVATSIVFPGNNEVLGKTEKFDVKIKLLNIETGFFSDPIKQYYSFPQTVNGGGLIQGHSHVVIQKVVQKGEPLDPNVFAFFKGLNDKAVNNILTTPVNGLNDTGTFRLCTMTSSFSHQPVLMPVAQRGAQDDCTTFKVIDDNKKRGIMARNRRRRSKLI